MRGSCIHVTFGIGVSEEKLSFEWCFPAEGSVLSQACYNRICDFFYAVIAKRLTFLGTYGRSGSLKAPSNWVRRLLVVRNWVRVKHKDRYKWRANEVLRISGQVHEFIVVWCVNERERTNWQFIKGKKKSQSVFHASVTATLTMLWRNSWSITGQTHEKLTSTC